MKLLNFRIEGIQLTVAGQVFDIHNAFGLKGYTYDTAQHIFELKLLGRNYFCNATGCTDVATDLRLTFRGVRRLHIKDVPYHPTNDGFSQAYFGGDAEWKGGGSELVGSIADDEPIDWSGSAHIEFHCGFEVLIFAETVEATYRQTATLEGKTLEGKATE